MGVKLGGIHDRLTIRSRHTKIEGRQGLGADFIFSGNVDARLQLLVIDGKACDFFHGVPPGRE